MSFYFLNENILWYNAYGLLQLYYINAITFISQTYQLSHSRIYQSLLNPASKTEENQIYIYISSD